MTTTTNAICIYCGYTAEVTAPCMECYTPVNLCNYHMEEEGPDCLTNCEERN